MGVYPGSYSNIHFRKMKISFLIFAISSLQLTPTEGLPDLIGGGLWGDGGNPFKSSSSSSSSSSSFRTTTTTKKPAYIVNLKYHKDQVKKTSVEDITLAISTAQNCCPVNRRSRCSDTTGTKSVKQTRLTETRTWDRTSGRSVTRGLTFRAEIPILKASFGREARIDYEESESRSWGRSDSKEVIFRDEFYPAVASPGERAVCKHTSERYNIEIPFTMTWSDRKTTKGVFRGKMYTQSKVHCDCTFPDELNPKGNSGCSYNGNKG